MRIFSFFAASLLLLSCTSRRAALIDYSEALAWHPSSGSSTVLVFLVDGLSMKTLEESLKRNESRYMRDFFLGDNGRIHKGHVGFPSETFPSIASLLTARRTGDEPIIGNKMYTVGRVLDFEEPATTPYLNHAIEDISVFTALKEKGQNSISMDYYFSAGSTVNFKSDVKTAVNYLTKDYGALDEKMLQELSALLNGTSPRNWPRFIFVHLLGVDFTAHLRGPTAPETLSYLDELDKKLFPVFQILRKNEFQGKKVGVVLTADHGFVPFTQYFDAEGWLKNIDPSIRVLNETRFVSLFFPERYEELIGGVHSELYSHPELEMFVRRQENEVRIDSRSFGATIEYVESSCPSTPYALKVHVDHATENIVRYREKEDLIQCPEDYDDPAEFMYAPFFISNMASYFYSPNRPDAIVLAAPNTSFDKSQRGGHGGVTSDEVTVPILLRNADITNEDRVIPNFQLLSPLFRD